MRAVFSWLDRPELILDLAMIPRSGEAVSLIFPGFDEHSYQVHWVRWHPQADPPFAFVRVAGR